MICCLSLLLGVRALVSVPADGLKLFNCNDGNRTKKTYANQRWQIRDSSIVFEKTGGCINSVGEAAGSVLDVVACNPLCASQQDWMLDQGKIRNGDMCLEATANERTLTAQPCSNSNISWKYDSSSAHLTTAGLCLDGGRALSLIHI